MQQEASFKFRFPKINSKFDINIKFYPKFKIHKMFWFLENFLYENDIIDDQIREKIIKFLNETKLNILSRIEELDTIIISDETLVDQVKYLVEKLGDQISYIDTMIKDYIEK